jgi:putative ABC transport system permease protein
MIADLWRDLRYGVRTLGKHKGFTTVTVLSLSLGLALTATTMAVVNAYLLRALPFPAARRLYHVNYVPQGVPEPRGLTSLDWKTLNDIIEIADNSTSARFYLTDGGYTQEAQSLLVAPGVLDALGVRVTLGRSLREEDFRAEADRVALISDAMWRERFGAAPDVMERQFRATQATQNGVAESFRVVGVLPPDFRYVRGYERGAVEILTPLRTSRQTYMVRLRAGVPVAFAEQRITEAVKSVGTAFPPNWNGVRLESVHERYVAGLKPMLMAITVAAGIVLVIVCVNVAALMLLRTLRRQKEMAVRVALGAEGRHIARMLIIESCLICGAALVLGLAQTSFMLRLLAPLIEERLGRGAPGGTAAIALDPTVLLIVGGAGLMIALALSFFPLLMPWQRRLADTLRREGRSGTDGPMMRRTRSGLIALEVAASLALLVGGGLMTRSVINLLRTDLGFQTEHIVRLRVALPDRTYPDAAAFVRFFDRFAERLSAAANTPFALTNFPPFVEPTKQPLEVAAADGDAKNLRAGVIAVSDGYFDLLGIRIKQGRSFTAGDRLEAEPVAIISETLARRLWPNESALGKRMRTAEQPTSNAPLRVWRTIVGVARDVRQTYTDTDQSDVYLPFLQASNRYAPLFIRSERPPSFWLKTLRATVGGIDQGVLISGGDTFDGQARQQLAGPRFLMSLLTGFALFATFVAMLGIYGVTAYTVQQREREVAIRIALGATPGAIIRMFLRQGGLVLAMGIAGGLMGAAAVARLLTTQLHGVQPFDAATLLGACTLMSVAGLLAIWWPARRAAAKTPLAALNEN